MNSATELPSAEPNARGVTTPRRLPRLVGLAVLVAACALYATGEVVPEGQGLVITRLGRPVRVIDSPGLYFHWPRPIDVSHAIDLRQRLAEPPPTAIWTRDKKQVVLGTFVVWRVEDPLKFLQVAGRAEDAERVLVELATAAQSQEVSRHDLTALVSPDSEASRALEMESAIARRTAELVRERLGIVVQRVGFQSIALPPENVAAMLEKMRAERQAEAGRLRSEGAKLAQAIRDDAHVKSQELLRAGREEAGLVLAEAEREAAEAFARAEQQSPDFYRFWIALHNSRKALGRNATLVLTSDAAPFQALFPREAAPRSNSDRAPLSERLSPDTAPRAERALSLEALRP